MALPPGILKLAGDSRSYVFSNFNIFMDHIKIIFPCLLILEFMNALSLSQEVQWFPLVTIVPMIYIYACFALSWHRTSIREPSSEHAINPLKPEREDMKFIKLFMIISFIPTLIAIVYGVIVGVAHALAGKEIAIVLGLLAIPLCIYMFIYLMRVSFVLPARAIGIDMTIEQAKKSSKGLIGRIFCACFIIVLCFFLVTFLYAFIVTFTAGLILGTEGHSRMLLSIGHFLLNIPVLFGGLAVGAMMVTVLSKAFQWRIQNG